MNLNLDQQNIQYEYICKNTCYFLSNSKQRGLGRLVRGRSSVQKVEVLILSAKRQKKTFEYFDPKWIPDANHKGLKGSQRKENIEPRLHMLHPR